MKVSPIIVIIMVVLFVSGIGLGWFYRPAAGPSPTLTAGEAKPIFYRNAMNPAVTSPVPAKDSMGMDYVPVYAGADDSSAPGAIGVDPVVRQSMGIRTSTAKVADISRVVKAVGRVDFNEERMTRLHPKTEGWIEEIRVSRTGDVVAENDVLLSIYSPHLVTTQQEYLLSLATLKNAISSGSQAAIKSAEEVVDAGRERLLLLDVPPHQIKAIEKSGKLLRTLHIHSPFSGAVIQIGARDGQFVTPRTELYMIADLSRVWVYADIYEFEMPWVRLGDDAIVTLQSMPGREFRGKISYIYPYMEAKTRSVKVRLELDNTDGALKPEMYADVTIVSRTVRNAIVVPSEAIVRSGTSERVFVSEGDGKFSPRMVKVGLESKGFTQIVEGVDVGEEVVSSGQFLIDSESSLSEATAKMMSNGLGTSETGSEEAGSEHTQMDGIKMDDPEAPTRGTTQEDAKPEHSESPRDHQE